MKGDSGQRRDGKRVKRESDRKLGTRDGRKEMGLNLQKASYASIMQSTENHFCQFVNRL